MTTKKYPDRTCPICNKLFAVKYSNQVCCTPEHQLDWKRKLDRERKVSIKEMKIELAQLRLRSLTDGTLEKAETALEQALEAGKNWEEAYRQMEAAHIHAIGEVDKYKQERQAALDLVEKLTKCMEGMSKRITIYEERLAEHSDMRKKKDKEAYDREAEIKAHLADADYCKRMKLTAKVLPCGDRRICWHPPCENIPEGKEMPVVVKSKGSRDIGMSANPDFI